MKPFARLFALFAALALSACGLNSVPTAEEAAKARWADVQNEYQRRSDLIPNLVATVKGYAAQEERVLTQVTQARARAGQVVVTPDQLNDPAALRRFEQAQGALSAALINMRNITEAYPDLKSNANFLALQAQLEGTENRISVARRDYNEAVQAYNTRIRTFPDAIGAKIFHGAKPMVPFQAAESAATPPTVSFDEKNK